jgi:hypothetical protein
MTRGISGKLSSCGHEAEMLRACHQAFDGTEKSRPSQEQVPKRPHYGKNRGKSIFPSKKDCMEKQ